MSPTPDRARCEIDLASIRHNISLIQGLAARARTMVVVKANAYGHGAAEVARAAVDHGVRDLAVATVGELEELRQAGIDTPTLVMGPLFGDEWRRVAAAKGHVAVWTANAFARAREAGIEHLHLKFDTGMGRLGVRDDDVDGLIDVARRDSDRVVGLMTHFASADERTGPNTGFLREQLLRFRRITGELAADFPNARRHAANSAATLREPAAHFDMVRCGIAVYGCCPYNESPDQHGLRPAMSVHSRLAAVKTLRSRDSVGYGRTWRAARGTRIAIIPMGYADGFCRVWGNQAEVLVGGRRCPVVGTVSMDQFAVDLGPESQDVCDEPVILVGEDQDERILVEDLARQAGTINYEVTCGFTSRVPRTYP